MTCVKIVLKTMPGGGMDVRVGWDETADATDAEKVSAWRLATEINERLLRCPGAVDLRKEGGAE